VAFSDQYNFPFPAIEAPENEYFMLIEISAQSSEYLDTLVENFYE